MAKGEYIGKDRGMTLKSGASGLTAKYLGKPKKSKRGGRKK